MSEQPTDEPWRAPDPELRRVADDTAREGTQRLVAQLWRYLQRSTGPRPSEAVHVVDLGTAPDANQAWLGQRLPFPTRWTRLDDGSGSITTHTPDMVSRLAAAHATGDVTIVTGASLLHRLAADDLRGLADLLAERHLPALFSLTRTGDLSLAPTDPDDALIIHASDARRRLDGGVGGLAVPLFAGRLRAAGVDVVEASTPWRLTSAHTPLMTHHLHGRAAAAVDHDPTLRTRAAGWLDRRLAQCRDGGLAVEVGHIDLLTLPG